MFFWWPFFKIKSIRYDELKRKNMAWGWEGRGGGGVCVGGGGGVGQGYKIYT